MAFKDHPFAHVLFSDSPQFIAVAHMLENRQHEASVKFRLRCQNIRIDVKLAKCDFGIEAVKNSQACCHICQSDRLLQSEHRRSAAPSDRQRVHPEIRTDIEDRGVHEHVRWHQIQPLEDVSAATRNHWLLMIVNCLIRAASMARTVVFWRTKITKENQIERHEVRYQPGAQRERNCRAMIAIDDIQSIPPPAFS